MTSRAERSRQKKAKTISLTFKAKPEHDRVVKIGAKEEPILRDGLAWLVKKGKLSTSQQKAAHAYRTAHREPQPGAMQSFLAVQTGGGTGAGHPPDYNAAYYDAQIRLAEFRTIALSGHVEMIRLMDSIVGNGLTLVDAEGGDYRKAEKSEPVLKVALDLMAQHLAKLSHGKATPCEFRKTA